MTPAADPLTYPTSLKSAEHAAISERRREAGVATDAPVVGLALSGGAIRSATFCLGLLQALARQRLVRHIDLLSTVSGGGYAGGFLGAAFTRAGASADTVERDLATNRSWPITWLRDNGRYLSPNGSGDAWLSASVLLRNWVALHLVLLTFGLLLLSLAALVRADVGSTALLQPFWLPLERFCWDHRIGWLWPSPWFVLPLVPLAFVMLPAGAAYWLTQLRPFMRALRWAGGLFAPTLRTAPEDELVSNTQDTLTRVLMLGLIGTASLFVAATVDSLGQSAYLRWSDEGFGFPAVWTSLTAVGAAAFGFGSKVIVLVEHLLGSRKLRVPFDLVALALALLWLVLIVLALAAVSCGLAWHWRPVHQGSEFVPMFGGWWLVVTASACLLASCFFSRSFGFVNLSSLQQLYAARLARAYLGASNPKRQHNADHTMSRLIPGDDIGIGDYAPQRHGGPLHLINVTVNETVSGKTQIERRDRHGVAMAIGPSGLSVGTHSHALWAPEPEDARPDDGLRALWETRRRAIIPILDHAERFHVLHAHASGADAPTQYIEALSVRHWIAISGAAFTTGSGATTCLGLSLLLGLANVRLGYWWDSGLPPHQRPPSGRHKNVIEFASRLLTRLLPVQTCLLTEFFARFHGPARRHWYLSDGGHFENTACYELIRRRVPLIIVSDAGADADYEFNDIANLVRKARIDFGAEIQFLPHATDQPPGEPGLQLPLPTLEQVVHPALLEIIGTPADFAPLGSDPNAGASAWKPPALRHAMLARIHYTDNDEIGWLLVVKPSLTGDETQDLIEYQRTHPAFPQQPTTDQFFDEAQWESYRKLGEHVGTELFTPPLTAAGTWSPSTMRPPQTTTRRIVIETRAVPPTPTAAAAAAPSRNRAD